MDFELSDEQRLLVDSVVSFTKKDSPIERFRKQRDVDPGWSKATWSQMGELGWLGLPFPESAGGLGTGFLEAALLLERLGATLVPEPYIPSVLLAGMALCKAGNKAQQAQYLAPMIAGETTLALAYAERTGRHDVTHVETRATKKPGGYMLHGQKVWVLHGDSADQLIVSARTSGAINDERGVSLFVVPRAAANLRCKGLKTMDGRRAALIELEGVELPREA